MLYGFGVYRCRENGGDRITAAGVAYDEKNDTCKSDGGCGKPENSQEEGESE